MASRKGAEEVFLCFKVDPLNAWILLPVVCFAFHVHGIVELLYSVEPNEFFFLTGFLCFFPAQFKRSATAAHFVMTELAKLRSDKIMGSNKVIRVLL